MDQEKNADYELMKSLKKGDLFAFDQFFQNTVKNCIILQKVTLVQRKMLKGWCRKFSLWFGTNVKN